jgi:hypothetical protein
MITFGTKEIKQTLNVDGTTYRVKVSVFKHEFSDVFQTTIRVREGMNKEPDLINIDITQAAVSTVHAILSSVVDMFRQASGLPMPHPGLLPVSVDTEDELRKVFETM